MPGPLSTAEVSTKQKQRNGLMLNVKKELAKGKSALKADTIDLRSVQVIIVKLRDYQKRINDYSSDIQNALTDEAQDDDIEKTIEADDAMMEMLAQLETTAGMMKEEARVKRDSPVFPKSEANNTSHMSDTSRIRLPKINLMSYNGDPLKWDEFWDYFDITFHSNNEIPVIEKFTYLRSLLNDEALRLVEGYRLTAANYDEVINALKERFGDPEIAIFQHFDAMLTLPVASGDVGSLQRVFDKCEAHIRSLIALDLSEETFGRVFAPIMLSKMPGDIRIELIRKKGRGVWTLAKLRELLRDELYARDMSKRSFGGVKPDGSESRASNGSFNPSKSSTSQHMKRNHFTASALPNAEKSAANRKLACQFCGDSHFNNKCSKYPTANSRKQKIRGSCYICLGSGHQARDCKKQKKSCYFCQSSGHHQSLCEKQFPSGKSENNANNASQLNLGCGKTNAPSGKSATTTIMSHDGKRGVLQTAVADVVGDKYAVSVRHMLDNGSDNSFINTRVAEQIGARCIGTEKIYLAGFADSKRRQQTYKVFEFDLILRNGKRLQMKAYGTAVIICSIDKIAFDTDKYPVLKCLPLAEPLADTNEHVHVDILIGSDYYYEVVKTERIPLSDGLMLLDTELGYVVAGRVNSSSQTAASMLLSRSPMPETNFDLERFWKLEDIGIKQTEETNDDEYALLQFNNTIQFDENEARYMVKWPFKPDSPVLPDNYGLAFGRLKSMVARANDKLMGKCHEIINGQLQKQIIEEVPTNVDGIIHYLPHHAVITPDKETTKIRVVYDASSKTRAAQPSLNDCVYRGPVMLENLCGLLLRFRLGAIGVTSDIEKAFLQIGLQKEDRDVTRFLWLRDITKPCTRSNIIHYRFRRVCFGVIASPFLLAATLTHHLGKIGTNVANRILSNLYVDNVVDGCETTHAALSYYHEAKDIFSKASMNLRQWYSNDVDFVASIPEADRGSGAKTKVLGLSWDTTNDTLSCDTGTLNTRDTVTKRFICHIIGKIFDPCGYFTPITSPAKWLLQELWQQKYDWDTPVNDDLAQSWSNIFPNLQGLSKIKIQRSVYPVVGGQTNELHIFCDASSNAFCAVAYLVTSDDVKTMSCLVMSKSRVSPLKQQSIPRLELLAVTIGVRLMEFVSKELRLPISAKYLWSDSQCVLHWILGKPVSTVFVRNRVKEIRLVPDVTFRYVPTIDNPADLPTRGLKINEIQCNHLWWHGPTWLTDQRRWPSNPIFVKDLVVNPSDDDKELTEMDESTTLANSTRDDPTPYLFDIDRSSSFTKLIRVTAWILRFIKNCRHKLTIGRHRMTLRSGKACSFVNGSQTAGLILSACELRQSKIIWERAVQKQYFPHVNYNPGVVSVLKSVGPVYANKNGIICCRTRLANSDLTDTAESPKLMPQKSRFTQLLIQDYHERFNHTGVKQTLAEIRCEYWITRGRSAVKSVLHECLLCRRQKGGPFQIPAEPDLPNFRTQQKPPFATVGLDYLGPLLICNGGGSNQKVWICLFTCAVTRAVHLEVVSQMDAANFLLCFRRFVAFYGCPSLVVSDNAGQFNLSRRVLAKLWLEVRESSAVQDFSAAKDIQWKFIPESAPWMGGFYERLVGVVKTSLKAALDRRKLNLAELQTIVYEVATIVNSRPIVYSEDEIGDLPLTPAHLIMRHRTIVPFVCEGEPDECPVSTQDKLIAAWKRLRSILDSFWMIWKKQYLLSLRERTRIDKQRNVICAVPYCGQVVLIEDKLLPRAQWRVARITQHIISADHKIRSVKLLLTNGKEMTRPVKQLYPLEITNCPEN